MAAIPPNVHGRHGLFGCRLGHCISSARMEGQKGGTHKKRVSVGQDGGRMVAQKSKEIVDE